MTNLIWCLGALAAGGIIGVSFGAVQDAARRRNERLQADGDLSSGWAIMPGSFRRVAYLLMALAIVQVICPVLFRDGSEWFVSGGVVGGYGLALYSQLRQRLARNRLG